MLLLCVHYIRIFGLNLVQWCRFQTYRSLMTLVIVCPMRTYLSAPCITRSWCVLFDHCAECKRCCTIDDGHPPLEVTLTRVEKKKLAVCALREAASISAIKAAPWAMTNLLPAASTHFLSIQCADSFCSTPTARWCRPTSTNSSAPTAKPKPISPWSKTPSSS